MKNAGNAVVIVAAGRGERAGRSADGPKQYRTLAGKAVLRYTLEAFATHPAIGPIMVAIHADDRELFERTAHGMEKRVRAVVGGATRQASTRLALIALEGSGISRVLIHDGVRPFVGADLVDRVLEAADGGMGALPALPVSDTLKKAAADGMVSGTLDRQGLHGAQTPQGFPFAAILGAHEEAHAQGLDTFTDDAAIAEWAGIPVRIVAGSPDNQKLTWARDLDMAEQRLQRASLPDIRTGNGYDVHRFAPGDRVVLCGVPIPHERRLDGHSDADVGLHALTDALLATCGAGDIGTHFPPSDQRWKDAASRIFVEEAARIVRSKGGRIANADVTLICEAPRIGPFREEMVAAMSDMLAISAARVSVKATTNEGLGFLGRGEGIAAIATATVAYPGELPE